MSAIRKPAAVRARKGEGFTAWRLLIPAVAFLLILVVAAGVIFRISLNEFSGSRGEVPALSPTNWITLLTEPLYRSSLFLTLRLSVLTTGICLLIAYPVALYHRSLDAGLLKRYIPLVMLVPILTNLVLQIVGFMALMAPSGPIQGLLPMRLAFTELGVLVVLVHHGVPFAFFALSAALQTVPKALEEAATVLGAGWWVVLRRVLLPLSIHGVFAGSLLVFAITFGSFVVPILVGGYQVPFLGVLVRGTLERANWPLSATIASALMIVALLLLVTYRQVLRSTEKRASEGGWQ